MVGAQVGDAVARRYAVLRPHLDERQRRLLLGTEAAELGPRRRVRAPGGGRKKLAETDPALAAQLQALVDPETGGDPMSLLVWTTKSTRNLAEALTKTGYPVSDRTVARMLAALGFSLQGNAKVIEGRQHEDRDAQFHYLT